MAVIQLGEMRLTGGAPLAEVEIAYETYGEMAPGRDNVILVAHGTTSSHQAAGPVTPDRRKGWWDAVIGPGKLFDTNRFCVVSSNVLGSCYGSTGPASTNPATGRPYGRDFPEISLRDIVEAQYRMLRVLGIERLVAVAGSSIGGFQALQWAVTYPNFMRGVVALDTATRALGDGAASIAAVIDDLAKQPAWNGGDYYAGGGMEDALTAIRIATLESYGIEAHIADCPGNTSGERTLTQTARAWAREFDANSLILLNRAIAGFNVEDRLDQIRAPLLYVMADTDEWFPARIGREVIRRLRRYGIDATYHEITSPHGHYATTIESEKWVCVAKKFLSRIADGANG
ncbi:MAG TPA: alpha/beta fold hydrolase [Thermohalobaculum sp.]|nr:alpha/beta fold hydrolase [Thermohalobaculum sp.]